ncbi:MAG: nucleoside monophosphate kinase [Phycisphaerales bacterium]|nr:nucleoside monophosphate kinase [Phycisphaerales bacterium]
MADKKYRVLLLFGYPGCGKGTQGNVLAGMPNLYHLAMGDIFRGLDKESDIGMEFMSYATKGQLVPDELTVRVWRQHVEERIAARDINPNYHILMLDGIPRTPSQVEHLSSFIDVLKIIHLKMDDRNRLVQRLKGRAAKSNRPDDAKEEVILNRIKVYENETLPVLECYDPQLIANINADQPPLAVLHDICKALVTVVPAKI